MRTKQAVKKLAIVFVFEIIVYFLVYVLEPFVIEYFHIGGSWLTGGWMFGEVVGAWVNLLVVPVLTFLIMWNYAKEPWYWLLWIPVYFLLKPIYYPTDFYLQSFGFDDVDVDTAAVTVLIAQYFVWLIVMIATGIRTMRRHKKEK